MDGPGGTKGRNKILFPFTECMGKTAHLQKNSLILCGYSNPSTRNKIVFPRERNIPLYSYDTMDAGHHHNMYLGSN